MTAIKKNLKVKKSGSWLTTVALVAIVVFCIFQVVNERHKEPIKEQWQTQLMASNLFGQNPQTVTAFLDYHLHHSVYKKVPYNAGDPRSPGHRVDYDRRIFVEFGPVAHTFDFNRGRSDWYMVADFDFGCDNKLGGWMSTSTPKKVQDGEVLCCSATLLYCHS